MDSGKLSTPLSDFSSALLPQFTIDPVSVALAPFGFYQYDLSTMFGGRNNMAGYGGPMDGYPPQGPHHMPPHPMPGMRREISYDTSSKDPQMLRSRIFIGNINTTLVTRDDIIKLCSAYGTLLGVTVFKGYAFVQFSNMNEADFAVSILNGYNWNNSCLDVKLALTGMKSSHSAAGSKRALSGNAGSNVNGASGGNTGPLPAPVSAGPAGPRDSDGPKMKKSRVEESHEKNKKEAKEAIESANQGITNLYTHGMPDTLICGGCRMVTSALKEFIEHRSKDCTSKPAANPVKEEE